MFVLFHIHVVTRQKPEGEKKMIQKTLGEGFDLVLGKVLKAMFALIVFGCFPYFLYLLFII
ncbi:hypothetical protein CHCC14814_2262 [Bacillus paralicheniformis]|nr:hypothetical protein CHCC14814_2262 [Bacillus paralicheniformis]